ncbi:MAG: triose-phosphate isomerase [Candidatus Dormibacteraeota bacterium]|nr:triose-phosphate isomerase [Candidatus Dormibacteraeota bacterium]
MTRRPLVAGNWKMNPASAAAAIELARGVAAASAAHGAGLQVAVFPPTVWLRSVALELQDGRVEVGAQDCYWEPSGPYTGATSVAMVAGWCQWTLVGHSERRQHFGMTDEDVALAAAAAVASGLRALICVGEREAEFQAGRTREVVGGQVRAALSRLEEASAEVAFAYEPVWAIGTGRTPDPGEVGEVLNLIRDEAGRALGGDSPSSLRVLYGGSVKPANIASFTTLPGCDGALVGGSSLDAQEFATMLEIVAQEIPR